ncbi:hypothetical protein [Kutzneria sp. NPDC052558]|uniref:hypothetical protein n=1 Tax=Kutzneria sp. NPDC052558 TaxID=3364121 RepID=UPI0037C79BAC
MDTDEWVLAPGNPAAEWWMTRPGCRTVLAVVPHLQAGTRLLDVLPVLETDHRVAVMFTTPATGHHWYGVAEFTRSLGGLVLPWQQAVRTRFDLALAACHWGVGELNAPLVVLPHGSGSVRSRIGPRTPEAATLPGHDLHPGHLMRDGRVVPAALVLAHDDERSVLRQSCPQALPRAVVVGDPCFDRMLASRSLRRLYREALGVRAGQRLVVVSTTWSPHSLFGTDIELFDQLATQLPAEHYRVVAVIHPFVWAECGRRQVLLWLAKARAAGLVVVPPEEGWRGALVGADCVVGDHGSVTQYAAGLGVPVLMATASRADVRPGSTADALAQVAAPLRMDQSLLPQIQRACAGPVPPGFAEIAGRITSRPGQSAAILRRTLYRLLGLPEPACGLPVSPVPLPEVIA